MNNELNNWCRRNVADMDAAEYDAEVRRRLWRRRVSTILDLAGGLAFMAFAIWAFWAWCKYTPDQLSGESDWTAEESREVR